MGSHPSQEKAKKMISLLYRPPKVWVTEEITLKIGFFDYGVCASPFEYETQQENGDKSVQLTELQAMFKQEYKNELGTEFNPQVKWEVGRLNSQLKIGRYSPLYYDNIGIVNNKFLMSKQEFQQKWEQAFGIAIQNFYNAQQLADETLKKQKHNLFIMDWIHYRTLIMYSFRDENLNFEQIIQKRIATKYQIYMRQKFQSKVINQKYKIQKLIRRLNKFDVDIFFLQDIDSRILQYLHKKTIQFRIAASFACKSAILISQNALKKIVGDSIRPLSHYNRKYLDPDKIYEFGEEFDFGERDRTQNPHFDTNQNRNFEFAKKKQSMKSPTKPKQNKSQSHVSPEKLMFQFLQKQLNLKSQNILEYPNQQTQIKQTTNNPNNIDKPNQLRLPTVSAHQNSDIHSEVQEHHVVIQQSKIQGEAILTYIQPEVFKGLAWNDSTLVQFLSNIILITSTFDFQFEETQLKKMFDSLTNLRKAYPSHTIIAAIDIQKQLTCDQLQGFTIYPNPSSPKKTPTVFKKKTLIQSKPHKAGHLIENTQDYFLSTAQLHRPLIMDIDHNEIKENPRYIPNQVHPYDHYLLSAEIKCTVTKKIIQEEEEERS